MEDFKEKYCIAKTNKRAVLLKVNVASLLVTCVVQRQMECVARTLYAVNIIMSASYLKDAKARLT